MMLSVLLPPKLTQDEVILQLVPQVLSKLLSSLKRAGDASPAQEERLGLLQSCRQQFGACWKLHCQSRSLSMPWVLLRS